MDMPVIEITITVRVSAYILRKTSQGLHELLLFKHPDCSEAPLQIPGGGVDPGESLEKALHREVWEESGLSQMKVIRKLGVAEICWRYPRKLISQRHCFLMEVSGATCDRWVHTVQGNGIDLGMEFSYFWHRPSRDFALWGDLGSFLHPEYVPELYHCPNNSKIF
jgi:ADP-ribose pyrophosphatase YjhB (NUDIX family)